jgi:glycosyltransferase involved in cell wall biosynthesis
VLASLRAGGAERVALNLAEAFHARGHEVDLLVVHRTGKLLDQVPAGIRLVDLGSERASRAVGALRRYVKAEAPTAIISIAFQANLLALVATLGLRHKPKLIVTVHSTLSRAFEGLPALRRWLLTAATKYLYPRADAAISVSHGAAADLARLGVTAPIIATIYNPVLRSGFAEAVQEKAHHPWLADRKDPVIMTAGRLAEAKNHRLLLAAFGRLLKEEPARLMIIGEGELRSELEAEAASLGIADKVSFTGHIDNPYPFMKEADLFVLSSSWEGFGNVLVEAMATATPVIATDCPHGPREILEDGKWGRLVPVGDADALAEAMLAVLRRGGIDARERAAEFTVERAAGQYLDILSRVQSLSSQA